MFPNTRAGSQSAPANKAFVVAPNNNNDLPFVTCMVTINQAGTLSFIGADGLPYSTGTLPVGSYPIIARRINATGTSAGGITGWAY